MEDLNALFERMTQTFVKALTAQQSQTSAPLSKNKMVRFAPRQGPVEPPQCNFCGHLEHFMRDCLVATEYINTGCCQRNAEGQIVLLNDAYMPREIQGKYLKE